VLADILVIMAISAAQAGGYVIAHITALKKPYITEKTYGLGLFSSLVLYSAAFSVTGYTIILQLIKFNFAFIVAVVLSLLLPTMMLRRAIQEAQELKKLTRIKPLRKEHRRQFYT